MKRLSNEMWALSCYSAITYIVAMFIFIDAGEMGHLEA